MDYICNICNHKCNTYNGLWKHKKNKHILKKDTMVAESGILVAESGEKLPKCKNCNETAKFKNLRFLNYCPYLIRKC